MSSCSAAGALKRQYANTSSLPVQEHVTAVSRIGNGELGLIPDVLVLM